MRPHLAIATVALTVVACSSPASFRDRIFVATSYNAATEPVFEITSGSAQQFATVDANGWLGPLVITTDGQFYAVTNAQDGSVFDITKGGDLTGATPVVSGLFTGNIQFIDGAAADANGNLYVANSEHGAQAIAKVDLAAKQFTTFGSYDNAEGLLVKGNTLYISEGGTGNVIARDLASGTESNFASGFVTGESHISGQLALDSAGHIWVNWQGTGASTSGLYDISAGGDFSSTEPAVAQTFDLDLNQVAFTSAGAAYVAGAATDNCYVATASGDSLQPFQVFVGNLGDNETIAVGP